MTDNDFKQLETTYKNCLRLRRIMRTTKEGDEFEKARDEYEAIDAYQMLLSPGKPRDLKKELTDTIKSISGGMIVFNDKQLNRIIECVK